VKQVTPHHRSSNGPSFDLGIGVVEEMTARAAQAPQSFDSIHHNDSIDRIFQDHSESDQIRQGRIEREASASGILLANSKSSNFNDFRSGYPGETINGGSYQPQTSLRLACRGRS